MRNVYLRQIVQAAIVLLNVSLVVFVLVRIVPGDPARLMLGMEASEEAVQAARTQFGFDRPLYVQYAQFVGGALRGDLGQSVRFRRPVGDLLRESFPATLELAMAATAIALVLAVPAGIYAAVHRDGVLDRLLMAGALIGQAMPIFWLGIMLITLFSVSSAGCPPRGGARSRSSSCRA